MTELTVLQQNLAEADLLCPLKYNEPMLGHTSFRIGGPVEVMAFPRSREELSQLLKVAETLCEKPVILGAGTNVLAPDEGLKGIVICLKDALDGMQILENGMLQVLAGVTMTRAALFASNQGLTGLEFAHGIPGTVGGGVYMNAGAYGGEIKDVVETVEVMDFEGNIRIFSNDEMRFSYRHSILEEIDGIVISTTFRLQHGQTQQIRETMRQLQAKRSASQPLQQPSAGSAFKRPIGGYAAALIDQAGLKGFAVGDAAVSTKHAGFVVNLGNATANDVKKLLKQVSDIVFEKSGIRLEPEIRIW